MQKESWSIDDFEIGCKIGEGRYGKIYLARVHTTENLVALKVIPKDCIVQQDLYVQLRRETSIQKRCRHPNIIRLLAWFWDSLRIFLVLEYAAGGSLAQALSKSPRAFFPEDLAAKYCRESLL